jgi:hypothetical protein
VPIPNVFLLHANNSTYDAGAHHVPASLVSGLGYDTIDKKFGAAAFKFADTGDLLQYNSAWLTPTGLNDDLSHLTFEFFWKMGSFDNRTDIVTRITFPLGLYAQIFWFGSGQWHIQVSGIDHGTITGLTGSDWQHVVMQFGVNLMQIFVDGVKVWDDPTQTFAPNTNASDPTQLSFGGTSGGGSSGHPWNMWIDEVRISVGSEFVYTDNFTPPTAPFLPPGDGP